MKVNRLASMYTVFFTDGPLRTFEDVKRSDTEMYARYFRAMRERNIFVAPSAFEVAMVSFAHTEEDFAKTLEAARRRPARRGNLLCAFRKVMRRRTPRNLNGNHPACVP